jgi:hypothetical protein
MLKRSIALGATALAALAFAACGDDGNSDADQITEAIEAAAVSGEASACTEFQTQRFTEQTSNETGEAAVRSCEQDAGNSAGDEIEVTNIEVDGDSATAEGAITGSFFDGQTIDVALVKEGDQWKLDELSGFTEFNRDAFLASFENEISSGEGASPEALDCLTSQIESQSDQQLQDFLVGADPQAEERIFAPCLKFFGGE